MLLNLLEDIKKNPIYYNNIRMKGYIEGKRMT